MALQRPGFGTAPSLNVAPRLVISCAAHPITPTPLCVPASETPALATSITLPVVRHPAVVAKTLTTLAVLARGPVVGGLGPGSSRRDHQAVRIPFEERWSRFDEALPLVRSLVRGEPAESGRFYPGEYEVLPRPDPSPGIWFASWGV